MSSTTTEGSQLLLGYQLKIFPSGAITAVERLCVSVLFGPALTLLLSAFLLIFMLYYLRVLRRES